MEFLQKLQAINFNSFNAQGDLVKGPWTLKTRYKMQDGHMPFMPSVQLVVSVFYNGAEAMTWGCTNDDQQEIVTELIRAKDRAQEIEFSASEGERKIAKALWNTIK